jgi:diaminopimelate decarboxylase
MLRSLVRPLLRPLVRQLRPHRVDLPLSTWGLARDGQGVLALDGVPLDALLDRHGSPLHVVNAARLARNAADFVAVPPGAARGCAIHYSVKTNPVPGVLSRLREAGVGAEVISAHELDLALSLGFDPAQIVYDGPAKSPASLRLAIARGLALVNLNSRCEIAPFAALARALGRRPRTGLRVVIPGAWAGQLGERIDTGAALRAFAEAQRCPELDVVALHAHLGGEIATAAQLDAYLAAVLAFTDELRRRLALDLTQLDLGGSLPCPTVRHLAPLESRLNRSFGADLLPREPGSVLSIRAAVAQIVARVEAHYRHAGRPCPRILLEPGRALTGDAQLLLTRVVHVQDEVDGVTHVVLDAGFCIASPVPNELHQLFLITPPRPGPLHTYRLVGPICSPADVLYPAWDLPALRPGDALAIMDSGAYFVPFASSFSFPQPGIAVIEAGHEALLRRAESFAHLTALDVPRETDGASPHRASSCGIS